MLKLHVITKFEVEFREFNPGGQDYNMVVKITPNSYEESLGSNIRNIFAPYYLGITDTTVTDKDYNCIVLFDDDKSPGTGGEYFCTDIVFFVKKFPKSNKPTIPSEPSKLPQPMEERVGDKFRLIRGPGGDVSIILGNNSIEFAVGDNKVVVGQSNISFYGVSTKYELPSDSQGGLVQETGFFRFFPKAFVPPFSIPDYLPNMELLTRTTNMANIVKNLSEVLKS